MNRDCLGEIRLLLRSVFWLIGLMVLVVVAISLAAEFGDVCYGSCPLD